MYDLKGKKNMECFKLSLLTPTISIEILNVLFFIESQFCLHFHLDPVLNVWHFLDERY